MEITNFNIKKAIISQIPEVELYNEYIIHNKVHYSKFDIMRVIPKGPKGFLVFKKDRTNNYCYFIELLSKKSIRRDRGLFINYKDYKKRIQVNKIYEFNCSFSELLTVGTGTILYGTLCHNNLKYFVTENIMYLKGRRLYFNGWTNMFSNIYHCISNYISSFAYNKNSIIVTTPITKELPIDITSLIDDLQYDVYCIQYIKMHNNRISYKTISKKNREFMFLKANIQSDIYELLDANDDYIGICHIPDYKTSVMLNNIFRDIKENDNLDYLEESEDEEEFEDISTDKFVDIHKKELFECVHNKKFNMWIPINHIDEDKMKSKSYNIYKIKY